MIISIASGKGGTGKTTVATNLAVSLDTELQLLDCDVEEPNAHLFLNVRFEPSEPVFVPVPEIDEDKCTFCGICSELCQFKAIAVIPGTSVLTFPELCHSCGGCWAACPEKAISQGQRQVGVIEKSAPNRIEFIHGRLRVGEAMAPPLVKKVKACARPDTLAIIDAPPGTSCPVIAAMKGADFVLLVTEPTPFGLHDLKLAYGVTKLLKIPAGLVINRAGLGFDGVHVFAEQAGLPVLMEIPFDRRIAEAYSNGRTIVDALPEYRDKFRQLYCQMVDLVESQSQQYQRNL
jgi:MinD superfamily P-loop ATPase